MKKTFIVTGTILSSLLATSSAFASTHTVEKGDTLWDLSKKYTTSVQDLKNTNKLTSNLIIPGQILKVDNKEEKYVVKAGDSLKKIAIKYHTTVNTLIKLNPQISNPNLIIVGQNILVDGQVAASAVTSTNNSTSSKAPHAVAPSTNGMHTVKLGDTLSSIAKANNKTVDFLLALNPEISNANKIRVGQTLKVAGTVVNVQKPSTTTQTSVTETQKEISVTPAKPVETKPAPTTPAKPSETKPAQTTQAKPVETKPAQTQTAAPTNAAVADKVLAEGAKYLGARYVYGASTSRTDAFDCSSFTLRAFKAVGISLPRTSASQAQVGTPVSLNALQKGDLVFFDTDYNGTINHVGIYAGNNTMINAATSKGVSYTNLKGNSYWEPRMVKAVRVIR
ncbi:LysM peptidoglycan-binding domain-containing protein [Priestia aryabhattai]|uniref:LysM peptidoglycan-binding domain-containing protein n=1 Tax=Priestia aryabhattai TaxID=412384 RepID=A0AAX6NBS8_PRIAR|nr:LysM peptidoglycan-binding domain-containing protein [Priestia aryabhattai]MDU9693247.1 LysM peptidoglycan-binding domain-containing protein [Priestia aryabhattai]